MAEELDDLAQRLIDRAFMRVGKTKALKLDQLSGLARRHYADEWQQDPVNVLKVLIRTAILSLPETDVVELSTTKPKMPLRQAACMLFNITAPEYGFEAIPIGQLQGKKYSELLERLKESAGVYGSVAWVRAEMLTPLRRLLAEALLHPDFPIIRAPEVVRAAGAFVVRPTLADNYEAGVRELLASSAAYVRDIRIDADLHIVRTFEPDLLENLKDASHPWPRAVIGEAGSGKSTLLWSLHQSLAAQPAMEPVLLSATWLLRDRNNEPVENLAGLFQEIAEAGSTPVLLLDTTDLMLHDEEARQTLLRLLDAVYVAGFTGLYSTRPQEAALLSHEKLRRHDLQSYDDAELDHAVAALVARYCSDAPNTEVATRVRRATARGLPVADVCRSPLLLRMLFDLSAPAAPELNDVDVTRLFDAYWQRRVIRDARTDTEISLRARAADNLSAMAGHAAIGLLASGLPELLGATLRETTAVVAGSPGDLASVEEGLAVLIERGVLVPSGELLGFFHQTMFEFAAAKGLLARSNPTTIGTLATRAVSRGGDLFVGAVLEQVLILAGANPLLQIAVQDAVETLVTSDSQAVQGIGLVAWAHYPALLDNATDTLRTTGTSALERVTRILPTIAAKPTGQTISQLMLIWQSTSEPHVRTAVLDAFARLALHAPRVVAEALDYLEPLQSFASTTVTHAMRRSFLGLLHTISSEARLLVRSTLVAMLMSSDDRESIELDYLASQWSFIGDDHLLTQVVQTLDAEGPPNHSVALGLGKVIAAEWHRAGTWDDAEAWADFLARAVDPGPAELTLCGEATLCAIGVFVVATNDDDRIRVAILTLLDALDPRVRDIVCQSVLRGMLSSESDAAAILESLARSSLANIGSAAQYGRIDDRQRLLLDLLAQASLPDTLLARLLPPHLEAQDWKADLHLIRIAPAAADHGHIKAQQFMEELSRTSQMISTAQLDALFSTQAAHVPRSDATFEAIVSIATRTGRTADLVKIVNLAERRSRRLNTHSPTLLAHAHELLAGDDESKRRGSQFLAELMAQIDIEMAWPELRAVLDDVDDPRALAQLIQKLWQQTPAGNVSAQLDYLGQFISVQPNAERPVTRPAGQPIAISVAVASAWAILYILGTRTEANVDDWTVIRTLGLYEVDQDAIFVDDRRFLIVCDYLARLGQVTPHQAGEILTSYLKALASGEFYGNITPAPWRRELSNAVQYACAPGDHRVVEHLIALCRSVDDSIAMVIATAIAERHYAVAREHLQKLSHADITASLRSFLFDLIRTHDRSFGTRAFPEVFAAAKNS
ncbi:hypothetical protein EDD99_5170 [Streptomyces sp. 846.5]|nr:hypothetical protein EDD99_5170 [Streptomyces sp. 846.5]